MHAVVVAEIRSETGGWKWTDLPAAWVLVLLVLGLFLGARWLYRRERGRSSPGRRLALACVRTLVLVAVVLAIAGPYREEVRTAEEKSHLVVLVDTSASMKNEDAYPAEEEPKILAAAWPDAAGRPARLADANEVSRLALVKRVLTADGARLLRRLSEAFVLHVFAFDEDWRTLGTTEPLTPDGRDAREALGKDPLEAIVDELRRLEPRGPRTRIGAALRNVATQFLGRQDQRFGGVVLITDGQDTSEGEPPLEVLTSLPGARALKVAAVGLGNPETDKNLRMEPIRAKDVVLVHDEVMFETAIRHRGFQGVPGVSAEMTVTRIRDADGNTVEEEIVLSDGPRTKSRLAGLTLPAEDVPLPVRLKAPFDQAGTYRIKVRGRLPPSHERQDAILDDNVAFHDLLVKDVSIRVLFVDREPRYEWRFLSNYLTREDPNLPGGGARRRSRFLTHVLLQSGDPTVPPPYTKSLGMQPRFHFPETREELFEYDVLILGDVDLARLATRTPSRKNEVLALIRAFVEEGGGIALEAGVDVKNPLDFLGTPLADLLPVSAMESDRRATEQHMSDLKVPFRVRLTDAGSHHPAFNILPAEDENEVLSPERVAALWAGEDTRSSLGERWSWYWMYRAMGGLRPGAVPLATVFRPGDPEAAELRDARGEPLVAFASMGFGRGRVFWSSIDDLTRIRVQNGDTYYGAFWEQVIRDLALYRLLGGNRRFKIFPRDEEVEVGKTAEIRILAQDENYEWMTDEHLDGVHVELPDNAGRKDLEGEERPRATSKEEGGPPGEYVFRLPVDRPGTYLVWIQQKSDVRDSGGRAEERFRGVSRGREDSLKLPDHRTLQEIARETDGRFLRFAELADLSLPAQTLSRVISRDHRSQWDKLWVLLLLAGLLGVEWALRKKWQMI